MHHDQLAAHKYNVMNSKQFLMKAFHFSLTVVLFYFAWLIFRYSDSTLTRQTDVAVRYNYIITVGFGALVMIFNRTYRTYLFGYTKIRLLAFTQFVSQTFALGLVYIAVSFGWNNWRNPLAFLVLLVVYLLIDILFSYFGNGYYYRLNPPKKTLLIYRSNRDKRRFGSISGKPLERLYNVVKEIQFDGTFDEIKSELNAGYEAVFVAGLNSRCRNGILKHCEEYGIRGFFLPHVGDVIMQGAEHIHAFSSPVMMVQRKALKPEYRVIKRILDIIGSLIGLILSSPVFLLTALAIKVYDRGPVFYKQVRLTKDSKEFEIIKFRSMRTDAEKDGVARLSSGDNDDRITPIGKIVRKCRLDELPQLINILKGDMSFVGPRPERPEIAEQYYKSLPDFRLRLQVKAGLTGYAQVYGQYNTDPYEKLEFDLMYINNMSLLTDLELMYATFVILFSKESTEGVEGKTAMDYEE